MPAWFLRSAGLAERGVAVDTLDLRGAIADLVVGALLAAVVSTVARIAKVKLALAVATLLPFLCVAANYANFEHILALDVPLDLERTAHATTETFVHGSVLAISRPMLLVMLVAFSVVISWRAVSLEKDWRAGPYIGILASGTSILWLWPLPLFARTWRGTHFLLLFVAAPFARQTDPADIDASVQEVVEHAFATDLDGDPRTELGQWRNVLVVMIEGASGCYLPQTSAVHGIQTRRTMPGLDRLAAERGVLFTSFVSHQRQTHRGEYAVLCGDYPELTSTTSKATELAERVTRTCLPAMLRDAGYRTVYLQPANLTFMLKHRFMPNAGFDEIRGHEFFTEGHARNGWGIDDLAFYEQSLEVIEKLQTGERQWFAALLTVGTHHPYLAPDSYAAQEPDAFVRALHYADDAVVWLLEELEHRGILDDTLVLVTSDEAAGWTDLERATSDIASQNCGLLVAFGKGLAPSRVDELFGQVDLGVSVLDALGLALDGRGLSGRSIFRRYDRDRLMFGSSAGRVYAWDGPRRLLTCSDRLEDCVTLVGTSAFARDRSTLADGSVRPLLAAAVERAAPAARPRADVPRVYALATAGQSFSLPPGESTLVFGGQYIQVPEGREAAVELELRVEGTEGSVRVTPDLVLAEMTPHAFEVPPLSAGERLWMRYRMSGADPQLPLNARLHARRSATGEAHLVIERAILAIGPRVGKPGIYLDHAIVEPRAERTYQLNAGLVTHRCVDVQAGPARGVSCPTGEIVYGPYAVASAGTRVVARFTVRGVRGGASVQADIVADRARRALQRCPAIPLVADETIEVTCELELETTFADVEGRLRVIADESPVDLEIEDASVELLGRRSLIEVLPAGRVKPRRK